MRKTKQNSGFTLIELIIVILLSSILAGFVISRFVNQDAFNESGFFEESKSIIRAAQKIATSSSCHIRVTFNSGTPGAYELNTWSSCRPAASTHLGLSMQILVGADGEPISSVSPTRISVSALDFYFDQIGQPRRLSDGILITNDAELDLTIASRTIQIEPLTGYVH